MLYVAFATSDYLFNTLEVPGLDFYKTCVVLCIFLYLISGISICEYVEKLKKGLRAYYAVMS